MSIKLSVIIPAHNASAHLPRSLQALRESLHVPHEVIVVDDSSTDATKSIAQDLGTKILTTPGRRGPAFARNMAAESATGEVLLFLDADVCVHPDTVARVVALFEGDPGLDAVIGSYDYDPSCQDFLSQYRNLMHAYVHQKGSHQASTFWSGCGAIRRSVFMNHSGFSETYRRPAVEDIELGYRLKRDGCKILLDRGVLVTHLKRWTFWNLIKTDILDRGIPWTELIMRDRRMPDDLNLQLSQRVSVALTFLLVGLSGALAVLHGIFLLLPLFAIVFVMLAHWWGESASYERPRRATAILCAMVALIAAVAFAFRMYGLIPPMVVIPALLLLRHRYNKDEPLKPLQRYAGIALLCASVVVSAYYLPGHHLLLLAFAVVVLLGLLNSQFYIFLAGNRGVAFMLTAIPFHLLYHFYNGLSFIAGTALHYSRRIVPSAPAQSDDIRPEARRGSTL